MSGGGAIADFDRDGFQDILFLSGGTGPDRLYINDGDGTFTDRAPDWGLRDLPDHIGMGAVAADVNDDGYPDVFVTSLGPAHLGGRTGFHRLLINSGPDHQGNFAFTNHAAQAGINRIARFIPDGFGATFGDIDLDGDLDLAVAGWYPIGHNALFRNDAAPGDPVPAFINITRTAIDSAYQPSNPEAPGLNNYGFSPRILDTDGDWHPEILWISDFGQSRYLRNDADGTFTDITEDTGTGLDQNGMGVTKGDLDNDGRPDFAVTAIFQPDSFGAARDGNRVYINQVRTRSPTSPRRPAPTTGAGAGASPPSTRTTTATSTSPRPTAGSTSPSSSTSATTSGSTASPRPARSPSTSAPSPRASPCPSTGAPSPGSTPTTTETRTSCSARSRAGSASSAPTSSRRATSPRTRTGSASSSTPPAAPGSRPRASAPGSPRPSAGATTCRPRPAGSTPGQTT
jgi:hypothetical protein